MPSLQYVWKGTLRASSAHCYRHRCQYRSYNTSQSLAASVSEVSADESALSAADELRASKLERNCLQRKAYHALGQCINQKPYTRNGRGDTQPVLSSSTWDLQGDPSLFEESDIQNDLKAWASLIVHRIRQEGDIGVQKTWIDLHARGIQVPTEGPLASIFWPHFLDVGLRSDSFLIEVIHYADKLCERVGKRWPDLYLYIMRHMMLKGRRSEVLHWHQRLIGRHVPSVETFRKLARDVFFGGGDQQALKMVYRRSNHLQIYDEIIPILTGQHDFKNALSWHFVLMRHRDFPSRLEAVEPLIRYYNLKAPWKAMALKRNIVNAGIPFASMISINLNKSAISRETMNVIHGKTFGISQKKYSDEFGSRWFATRWVSLDLAISALHALGIKSIGPLSLQAIALREGTPRGIINRINQLQELGISTGESIFSKAVESFARKEELEYLNGLLQSDQHPDSLENLKIQEDLLAAYARAGDWIQFRRTMAIYLLESAHPKMDQHNATLRVHITNGDRVALLRTLEVMRMSGSAIRPTTIQHLLHEALPQRRRGHAPNTYQRGFLDLTTVISVLKRISIFNKNVPKDAWRGVLRRLGMLGRLDELDRLCLWLVTWYETEPESHSQPARIWSKVEVVGGKHQSVSNLRAFKRVHPLRTVFSDAFQQAVVEWGFIHQPIYQPLTLLTRREQTLPTTKSITVHDYTRGLRLLRLLQSRGVFVDANRIRRTVLTRLALLYGPRTSNSVRNRILKQQNNISLENIVEQINRDWGEDLLPDIEPVRKRVQKV